MPLIELIQDNNTTYQVPLRYKGYADMNPILLAREHLNHDEYAEEEDYYNADSDESDIDDN